MNNVNGRMNESLLIRIEEYIKEFQAGNGRSPTQKEIADKCEINTKRAFKYVRALANRGIIDLKDNGSIAVPAKLDSSDFNFVPMVGKVRCGKPSLAIEDYEGIFRLPREFTGAGEFFMLKANGDSMVDANIFEGDYLVIRKQETADYGDIVVACRKCEYNTEEEATLKRFICKNGKPVLHPENEKYEDADACQFRIIGKLKCIIRDMETD